MGRRYSVQTFRRRLEPLADFNLTTDVIVGFPGEDEAAFRRTLEVVRDARITKVHVFPYSPRPGHGDGRARHRSAGRQARSRRTPAAVSHEACLARWREKVGGR